MAGEDHQAGELRRPSPHRSIALELLDHLSQEVPKMLCMQSARLMSLRADNSVRAQEDEGCMLELSTAWFVDFVEEEESGSGRIGKRFVNAPRR